MVITDLQFRAVYEVWANILTEGGCAKSVLDWNCSMGTASWCSASEIDRRKYTQCCARCPSRFSLELAVFRLISDYFRCGIAEVPGCFPGYWRSVGLEKLGPRHLATTIISAFQRPNPSYSHTGEKLSNSRLGQISPRCSDFILHATYVTSETLLAPSSSA